MDLIIFFPGGTTYRFKDVSNLVIDGDRMTFRYYGQTTEQHRTAVFCDFIGYSVAE